MNDNVRRIKMLFMMIIGACLSYQAWSLESEEEVLRRAFVVEQESFDIEYQGYVHDEFEEVENAVEALAPIIIELLQRRMDYSIYTNEVHAILDHLESQATKTSDVIRMQKSPDGFRISFAKEGTLFHEAPELSDIESWDLFDVFQRKGDGWVHLSQAVPAKTHSIHPEMEPNWDDDLWRAVFYEEATSVLLMTVVGKPGSPVQIARGIRDQSMDGIYQWDDRAFDKISKGEDSHFGLESGTLGGSTPSLKWMLLKDKRSSGMGGIFVVFEDSGNQKIQANGVFSDGKLIAVSVSELGPQEFPVRHFSYHHILGKRPTVEHHRFGARSTLKPPASESFDLVAPAGWTTMDLRQTGKAILSIDGKFVKELEVKNMDGTPVREQGRNPWFWITLGSSGLTLVIILREVVQRRHSDRSGLTSCEVNDGIHRPQEKS